MFEFFIVVDTDNFGGNYPNEKYLSITDSEGNTRPRLVRKEEAEKVAEVINSLSSKNAPRWYKVELLNIGKKNFNVIFMLLNKVMIN